MEDTFEKDVLAQSASLRAFAISLSGNGDRADDLVQETFLRAFANKGSFQPDSNLPAWLFTILRNLFRSDYRKRRREVEDADGSYAKTLMTQPDQVGHVQFEEFREGLNKLPKDQSDALMLVGASGFSYEDAAVICGCAVGTIKSRLNRAREKMHKLVGTFELRELNKKSWNESDKSPDQTYIEPVPVVKKKRITGMWRETEKTFRTGAFFHPPEEASPVKRFTKKEIQEVPIPTVRKEKRAMVALEQEAAPLPKKPTLVIDGVAYEFIGTTKLQSGQVQSVYKAA
jgi:RNA polymerase sigma-70 factor (ECF subfamily)